MKKKSKDIGKLYWWIHHGTIVEVLSESIEIRIWYVQRQKLESEIPTRLAAMKPVKHPSQFPIRMRQIFQKHQRLVRKNIWNSALCEALVNLTRYHWHRLYRQYRREYPDAPRATRKYGLDFSNPEYK